ncbi:hypothetical protein ACYCVF_33405 [Bradyrhizobium sp. 1.29L]
MSGFRHCVSMPTTGAASADKGLLLRKMREHVVEYFQGGGHKSDRWSVEIAENRATVMPGKKMLILQAPSMITKHDHHG